LVPSYSSNFIAVPSLQAPAAERTVQQTLEKIRAQAAWLKRDQAGIAKFLNAKGFSADGSKAGSNKV